MIFFFVDLSASNKSRNDETGPLPISINFSTKECYSFLLIAIYDYFLIISYNASLFFLYYRIIFASILPYSSPSANLYRLRTVTMRIIFAVDKIQAGTTDIIPACALNVFLNAAISHQIRPSATWNLCNNLLRKFLLQGKKPSCESSFT